MRKTQRLFPDERCRKYKSAMKTGKCCLFVCSQLQQYIRAASDEFGESKQQASFANAGLLRHMALVEFVVMGQRPESRRGL